MNEQSTPAIPQGWYPDPQDDKRERYWDGNGWTDRTQEAAPAESVTPATTPGTVDFDPPKPRPVATDDEATATKRADAEESAIQARINAAVANAVNEERTRASNVPQGDANVLAAAAKRVDEDVIAARRAAPFYCPGCGKTSKVEVPCVGVSAAPHPPIDVVSTDELAEDADTREHTPAPASV